MAMISIDERPYRLPKEFAAGRIGVVTVTYNSAKVLPDFVVSINRQSYADFTVYAVDNASRDNTLEQLDQWNGPRVVVIANASNVGVAAGNNQGIRSAIEDGCEYILLLNNDVVFGSELFQQLLDGLNAYQCSMTTPKTYFYEPGDVIWCAGGYFQPRLAYRNLHYGEGKRDAGQFDIARPVTYAPTCCVLIRREVFRRIGLMDERYFVYSDDTDFMLRAGRAGEVLYYIANAKLWHKVNSLTGTGSPFSMHYGARNRALFIAKHVGLPYSVIANLAYGAYYLLRLLTRKDNLKECRIKLAAWSQGWRIPSRLP